MKYLLLGIFLCFVIVKGFPQLDGTTIFHSGGAVIACGPNMILSNCTNVCNDICGVLEENCDRKCYEGCDCKSGYVFDRWDRCVLPENCRSS